jgi:uncharacterized protein
VAVGAIEGNTNVRMTAERHIDYEALAQGAMRGIVRTVLGRVANSGLPGEHHFYIAFNTEAPGVVVSKRLKEKYPQEMTVVLQHRFWDLTVTEERFEVKLTFDGIPERLSVPFTAVKVFFDPSVPYGLQFEDSEATEDAGQDTAPAAATDRPAPALSTAAKTGQGVPQAISTEKKPRPARKSRSDKSADPGAGESPSTKPASTTAAEPTAANDAKIVSLDKFRKK